MPMASTPFEYCRKCDTPLGKTAKVCPRCGRRLLPFCLPSIEASILAAFVLFLVVGGVGTALWDEYTFNHMTPAEHLAEAMKALRGESGVFDDDGIRHARAVPANAPEAQQATEVATAHDSRLEAARDAKNAQKNAQATAVR